MTDDEIRTAVRDAIARRIGPRAAAPESVDTGFGGAADRQASHSRFLAVASGDGDGACVIEPSVRCTHCGYCQSYGH